MLDTRALTLAAGNRVLVEALDLMLPAGEVLGILGANGAGKSTLLATLAGLIRPQAGEVRFEGTPLAQMPAGTRAQALAFLPQDEAAGFMGSVAEFVALGAFPLGSLAAPVEAVLAEWALEALASAPLARLSGGERQRARLAQLAMQDARVLLADEPLNHLDPAHQARTLCWLRRQAAQGRAVAFTLHDPSFAARHCDRLLFLHGNGRWQAGTPAGLLSPASLAGLYGAETAWLWSDAPFPPAV